MLRNRVIVSVLVVSAAVICSAAWAVPEKNTIAPSFTARDVFGRDVSLDQIMADKPDMVIMYFFTTKGGPDIHRRLAAIDMQYGRDKVRIIAFGVKEDEAALKKFAEEMKIDYYIISDEVVENLYGPMSSLPLTFILKAKDKTIVSVVQGSGETAGAILTRVAETYLMQDKPEEAVSVANMAQEQGEEARGATEVRGYAFTAAGKLDDAEKEFGVIECDEGLAKVALERGEYDKAIDLASQGGGSGYADTVKATALMRTGKLDEAATAAEAAAKKPAADWQRSEGLTVQGRLVQEKGDTSDAVGKYQEAFAMDPYNVVALSNEGAAYRSQGDLDKAAAVLEKAKAIRDDDLVVCMLKQIQQEMEEANDVKRGELIRAQIQDLSTRWEEMKKAGTDKPVDAWSTRPLVLAFLPSSNKTAVFFERAGTDVVLRRELEAQVQSQGAVRVVERELLDKLLQELELGSSELAEQNTQLQLGKLFSAKFLGFVDFAQAGADTVMYLRLVDTETTGIAQQLMRNIKNADNIAAVAQGLAQEMVGKVMAERELKGLIAEVSSDGVVLINLGKAHGVKPGQTFTILEEGEPIEVGGRVIAYRPKPIGQLEVTEVEDEYATCKVVKVNEGVKLAKEMKIKVAKAQ